MASGFSGATAQTTVMSGSLSVLPAILSTASSAFRAMAESARTSATGAVSAIRSACAQIQSTVSSLSLRLPRIQVGALPHFYITGSFDARTGSVPRIGVSWYASGGIFDAASVIGVGERGPEAVVPLTSRRMRPFAKAIAESMAEGAAGTVNNYYIDGVSVSGTSDEEFVSGLIDVLTRWTRMARS